MTTANGPLAGFRVLELGQLVAGPHAGMLLAWFGAEVIKIEPPQGDPVRSWRTMHGDTSVWWRGLARNKRLVRLDLRTEAGRAAVRRLVPRCDVVVENLRPGRLEAWGLGPDVLHQLRPDLVLCRISGYGQDGPLRDQPGYASVAEARGGLRALTGVPGARTVRTNLSLGDTVAGLQAAFGITLALLHRERGGGGQTVDVSLLESVFSLMEGAVTEAALGQPRGPSGATISGVAPSGAFRCADGDVVLGANGESLFARLCEAMGQPGLAADPRFQGNLARVEHRDALHQHIERWTRGRTVADVVAILANARVPCGPIQGPADLLTDPQLVARGAFVRVSVGGQPFVLPEPGPRLTGSPGRTTHAGGALGADTEAVLRELAGMTDEEIAAVAPTPPL